MSDSSAPKSAVDKILDVGVFAPLGLLLTRDKVVQELAQAGRKQVAFSRSLGRAALKGLARGSGSASSTPAPKTEQAASPPATKSTSAAIAGYSDLTARQVIQLVASCSPQQAAWIRTQETAGKNRVTVLRALDSREG